MKSRLLILAYMMLFFSCGEESGFPDNGDHEIAGTWLNVEQGYSPGSGYVTEKVPENPALTLRLQRDLRVSSNMEGFSKFRFYRLSSNSSRVVFYEGDPGPAAPDFSGVLNTYGIEWEGSMMKLSYRGCIEGCHLGFRYLAKPAD